MVKHMDPKAKARFKAGRRGKTKMKMVGNMAKEAGHTYADVIKQAASKKKKGAY